MDNEVQSIQKIKKALDAEYRHRLADDFSFFYNTLTIPSGHGAKTFSDCIQPYQIECFENLGPSLRAVQKGKQPAKQRFWLERTKKAAKDADLAVSLLWLLSFSERPLLCQVLAADQGQANITKRRISDILFYNPYLKDLVEAQHNKVINKKGLGEIIIEATDKTGAHGETPDVLVLNELVHVAKWEVMEIHMNNADGVPQGIVIVSTNAGYKGTVAETWRDIALAHPKRWFTHIWNQPAPWINKEDVEAARERNVGSEFERLWKGRWVSGKGKALDENDINGCFVTDTKEILEPEDGWIYLGGLDLGISRDHSGVVLVGVHQQEQRIKVGWIRDFRPIIESFEGKLEVDGEAVEQACLYLHQNFHVDWFGYDPAAGGSFMAQRLRKKGIPMMEMSFASPTNLTHMATAFVQSVRLGKLECYEDEDGILRRDMAKFTITEKIPTGFKLESVSDEHGHADVGTALVICLPRAMQMLEEHGCLYRDDVLGVGDFTVLTKEEMDKMPEDLREICDMNKKDDDLVDID